MGPTPMLYFAPRRLACDGGIQVTGSHNPTDYNGFKMVLAGRAIFGEEIQDLGRRAADGDWTEGHGAVEEVDILDAYVDRIVQDFQGGRSASAGMRATASPARSLEMLVARCRASITRSTARSTAISPTTIPIRREANLADLKALVAAKKLDLGIAFDGDGDRLGVVDGKGRVI